MLSFGLSSKATKSIAAADSGTAASVSGTTSETVLKIIPLSAGVVSAKTIIMAVSCSLANTAATVRTYRVRISTVAPADSIGTSGLAGTVVGQWTQSASNTACSVELAIRDRLGSSQRCAPIGQQSASMAANAWTAASDTTAAREIVITCQLAAFGGSETGVVEFYTAELVP